MRSFRWFLVLVVASGLAVDAYVHFRFASAYPSIRGSVSEALLFRGEAVLAVGATLLLLARPRRLTAAVAAIVAGGGLAAVLLYRYVDVGALGPLPNMYEPFWFTYKAWSAVAEGVSTAAAVTLVITGWPTGRVGAL